MKTSKNYYQCLSVFICGSFIPKKGFFLTAIYMYSQYFFKYILCDLVFL
jgi:hypothetical protein